MRGWIFFSDFEIGGTHESLEGNREGDWGIACIFVSSCDSVFTVSV